MIVLDASAAVEMLADPRGGKGGAARARVASDSDVHAPQLFDLEVLHVLRRAALHAELTPARAEEALTDLEAMSVTRHSHTPFRRRIWQLRDVASAYDAAYLALAEALEAPLLTADARLARTTGHAADVELLA